MIGGPEMARLAQRQDQLERQQRDSTRNVEALQRDGDALKRDVRPPHGFPANRHTDRQLRDGERRVSRLERSRDTFGNLFWFSMPLVAAVAVIIRPAHRRRRIPGAAPGSSESPRSVHRHRLTLPWAGSGGTWPPGSCCCRDAFPTSFTAPTASTPPGQPWPAVPGPAFFFQSFNR